MVEEQKMGAALKSVFGNLLCHFQIMESAHKHPQVLYRVSFQIKSEKWGYHFPSWDASWQVRELIT